VDLDEEAGIECAAREIVQDRMWKDAVLAVEAVMGGEFGIAADARLGAPFEVVGQETRSRPKASPWCSGLGTSGCLAHSSEFAMPALHRRSPSASPTD